MNMNYSVLLHSVNEMAHGHDKNDENDLQERIKSIKETGLRHFTSDIHRTAVFQFAKDYEDLLININNYSYNNNPSINYSGYKVIIAIPDMQLQQGAEPINTLVQCENKNWQNGEVKNVGNDAVGCLYDSLICSDYTKPVKTPPEFILGIAKYENDKIIEFSNNSNHFSIINNDEKKQFINSSGIMNNIKTQSSYEDFTKQINEKYLELHRSLLRNDIAETTRISKEDKDKYLNITSKTLNKLTSDLLQMSINHTTGPVKPICLVEDHDKDNT